MHKLVEFFGEAAIQFFVFASFMALLVLFFSTNGTVQTFFTGLFDKLNAYTLM